MSSICLIMASCPEFDLDGQTCAGLIKVWVCAMLNEFIALVSNLVTSILFDKKFKISEKWLASLTTNCRGIQLSCNWAHLALVSEISRYQDFLERIVAWTGASACDGKDKSINQMKIRIPMPGVGQVLASSLLKVRKLNNLVRVIMRFAPLSMQTERVRRHGGNLITTRVRILFYDAAQWTLTWLVCDIISVISPPGHTSYPKRKLEKLFSPQLGDEEWLGPLLANVTIDSTGL